MGGRTFFNMEDCGVQPAQKRAFPAADYKKTAGRIQRRKQMNCQRQYTRKVYCHFLCLSINANGLLVQWGLSTAATVSIVSYSTPTSYICISTSNRTLGVSAQDREHYHAATASTITKENLSDAMPVNYLCIGY